MARLRSEYSKVLDEIDQEREPLCENCQKPEFEHSHLIKRDFDDHAHMCVKANIRRNCRNCHHAWENGRLWEFDNVGPMYLKIVGSLSEQYHRQKVAQFERSLATYREKNWLAISNRSIVLPKWVEEWK